MATPNRVPLDRNEFLRFVPKAKLDAAALDLALLTYTAGDVIFEAGDLGDACYLIERGSVRISVPNLAGNHETVAILGPGDFFGELALYERVPRSARATALEYTQVGRLDQSGFERLREIAPLEITSALAEANMERVRATNMTLIHELATAGRLRDIGEELATISHNLRSPFATIMNSADLLRDFVASENPSLEQIARFVEIIHRTAARALQNTDELLNRLRGERQPEWTMVTPSEIVEAAEQQVRGLRTDGRVALCFDVRAQLRIRVQRSDLEAALVNLIRNALEALPPEGGAVSVVATAEDETVVFTVADTGRGIPAEYLERVFEPRFTHGKTGGTGLGLPHVRAVAERHGGRVELVQSDAKNGTIFRLTIPAR